jgi:Haem-NO-binding
MYGLVNKAFEQFVRQSYGDDRWAKIRKISNLEVEIFLNMRPYPDQISYELVRAMSQELELPADQVLRMVGRYWLQYTAAEGYGDLLILSGNTFEEVLFGLNQLHTRIQLIYHRLQPPSFEVSDVTEDGMLLHYRSKRPGLAWFVVGLIEGLGSRFNTQIQVELVHERELGADHDVFRLRFLKGAPDDD